MENRSPQENLIAFLDETMWRNEKNRGINIIHLKLCIVFNLQLYDLKYDRWKKSLECMLNRLRIVQLTGPKIVVSIESSLNDDGNTGTEKVTSLEEWKWNDF